jgi:cytochrome P450
LLAGEGGSVEVEMQKHMMDVTSDIISRTAFGGSYERGKKVFEQLCTLTKLMVANDYLLSIPVLRNLPTKGRLNILRHKKELEQTIKEIIQVRKDQIKKGQSESYGSELLGLMIRAADEDASLTGENAHFDLQSLIDECKTFYLAGHDTTSTLLTWTVMLLGTHTEWQDRARAEVFEVCGDQPPNADTIGKLKVLTMIVNESLRLFPPFIHMYRSIVRDVTIDGLHLPKDVVVFAPRIALQNDPDLWGDDFMKFKPERFADGVAHAAKHQLAFMPFSFGPRNCVGSNFALQEAKVVLAMLLQQFHFRLSPRYRHSPKVTYIALKPQYGMPLILEKVQN